MASRVRLAVKDAFFRLRTAEARIDVAKTAVTQAEAALRIVTDRYQTGLSTIVDLLGNETALTQAKANLAEALHDQLVSTASLELAVGIINREGF